jgi:hypothetical protein
LKAPWWQEVNFSSIQSATSPQVGNHDPAIGLEMLPSHQKAILEKSEAVPGISIPYVA